MLTIRGFVVLSAVAIGLAFVVGCDERGSASGDGRSAEEVLDQQEIEMLIQTLNRPDPMMQERAVRALSRKSGEELKPVVEDMKAALKLVRNRSIKQALTKAISKAGG